ncbi:site-specific integrase, partial [Candidatus Pacearchaeota archaeon]|nr:site-specific integrase [Candidatus Pacearchaeota archaeon]
MKIDPYNSKETYFSWRESAKEGIAKISRENSTIILQYLDDMEKGANVAVGSPKGARSYLRLNSLKARMCFFAQLFEERFGLSKITDINEDQIITFFSDMRKGVIKKVNGKEYKSNDTYTKIFRAFWHWYEKSSKKKGIEIKDITVDLDTSEEKPDWVYLTEEQIKRLSDNAKFDYKVLILFLFDSGIRAPTELLNVKVSDLYNDCKELNIRQEGSKTFARRIKLMICSTLVKKFIILKDLKSENYLFDITPKVANKYLKRLGRKLFGDIPSPAGQKYSDLTMYDLRHCSCCYWLPLYKSESALKYRFGWKKSEKIHYYSELLGMRDTISEDDILIDVTRTELEKRLERTEKEKQLMQEKLGTMDIYLQQIVE